MPPAKRSTSTTRSKTTEPKAEAEKPKPAARKRAPARKLGPVEAATKRDLAGMPPVIRNGALAASALQLAREMDAAGNSATSKSMCAKAHMDLVTRLLELAPPKPQKDRIDEVKQRRDNRRRRAGAAAAKNLSGT